MKLSIKNTGKIEDIDSQIDKLLSSDDSVISIETDAESLKVVVPYLLRHSEMIKNSSDKKYVLTIDITNDDDITALQYITLFLAYRGKNTDEYIINADNLHSNELYYQASQFLYLIRKTTKYGKTVIFRGDVKKSANAVKVPGTEKDYYLAIRWKGNEFGAILPIFPIDDRALWNVFKKNVRSFLNSNDASKARRPTYRDNFDGAIRTILTKYQREIYGTQDKHHKLIATECKAILESTDVLTFIIFGLIYTQICSDDGEKTKIPREDLRKYEKRFALVFERASSYAHGILQLAENIVAHACTGFITFRALHNGKPELMARLINPENKTRYNALQIFVSDLSKTQNGNTRYDGSPKKMSDVFRQTLQNRMDTQGPYTPSYQDMVSTLSRDTTFSIQDMFLPDSNQLIGKYYQHTDTIAHHYGLQILDFAVSCAYGEFRVTSGDANSTDFYSSAIKGNGNIIHDYIPSAKIPPKEKCYYMGTRYDILFPIVGEGDGVLSKERRTPLFPDDIAFSFCDTLRTPSQHSLEERNINILAELQGAGKNKSVAEIKKEHIDDPEKGLIAELKTAWEKDKTKDADTPFHLLLPKKLDFQSSDYFEILAKAIFSFSVKEEYITPKNIAITGFGNQELLLVFARLYSQVYNRFGKNHKLLGKQVLLSLHERPKDMPFFPPIVFSGENLSALYFTFQTHETSGLKRPPWADILAEFLVNISIREKSEPDANKTKVTPHVFDSLKIPPDTSKGQWFKELDRLVSTPIYNGGIRIHDEATHIQVSGVHMDAFYSADPLFGSAYWSRMFARWLGKKIHKQIGDKKKKIILLGYENVLEPVLSILNDNLCSKYGYMSCEYMVFENERHIDAAKKSKPHLRGIDRLLGKTEGNTQKNKKKTIRDEFETGTTQLVLIMGVSSTLSTYPKLFKALQKEELLLNDTHVKYWCYSILQSCDSAENRKCGCFHNICEIDAINKTIKSTGKEKYLENAVNEQCTYLITVETAWYDACKCPLCYCPDSQKAWFENAIFSTDDTSLVPALLLESPRKIDCQRSKRMPESAADFFTTEGVPQNYRYQDCLYYDHLNRAGAHYQYYIRTAKLYDVAQSDETFNQYAEDLRKVLNPLDKEELEKGSGLPKIARVNIIVAPAHFSNENFPDYINRKIFLGKAHIVRFDAQKTFRSNFEWEFSRYSNMAKEAWLGIEGLGLETEQEKRSEFEKQLAFYYVDDQINTGNSYNRAQTLVNSLLMETGINDSSPFSGVFTLVDRHSSKSKKAIITNPDERYYSFFRNIPVPAIRSQGDSCPLCKRVAEDKKLEEEAALVSTALMCLEKRLYHREKDLDDIRQSHDKKTSEEKRRHMLRFETEQNLYKIIKKAAMAKSEETNFSTAVYNAIREQIAGEFKKYQADSSSLFIEYLIALVKALSRPFLSYRPAITTVAIVVIKMILEGKIDPKKHTVTFSITKRTFSDKNELICNEKKNGIHIKYHKGKKKQNDENRERVVSLYISCLNALASLNSAYLINCGVIKQILNAFYTIKGVGEGEQDRLQKAEEIIDESDIAQKSFLDYLVFAVFRVIRDEKFGNSKRANFETELEEELGRLLSENPDSLVFIKLFSLLYLESAISPSDSIREKDRARKDRERQCDKYKRYAKLAVDYVVEDVELQNTDGKQKLVKDWRIYFQNKPKRSKATQRNNDDLNNDDLLCLRPMTKRTREDAYDLGYEKHFRSEREKRHLQIANATDKNGFLSGKLTLNTNVTEALRKYGISLFCNKCNVNAPEFKCKNECGMPCHDSNTGCSFIYLRIDNNYSTALKRIQRKKIKETLPKKVDQEKRERFDKEKEAEEKAKVLLAEVGVVEMYPAYIRIPRKKDEPYLKTLKRIRNIISNRQTIVSVIAKEMSEDSIDALIFQQEKNEALEISKSAVHASTGTERDLVMSKLPKETNEGYQWFFTERRRLLANRFISAAYRAERIHNVESELIDNRILLAYFDFDEKYTQYEDANVELLQAFKKGFKLKTNKKHYATIRLDTSIYEGLETYTYQYPDNIVIDRIENPTIEIIFLLAFNAVRYYNGNKNFDFEIKAENNALVFSANTGITDPGEAHNILEATLWSIALPPEIRQLDKDSKKLRRSAIPQAISQSDDGRPPGVTLWTLARYAFRACGCKPTEVATLRKSQLSEVGYDCFKIEVVHCNEEYQFVIKMPGIIKQKEKPNAGKGVQQLLLD